jgi:hypothetical protein
MASRTRSKDSKGRASSKRRRRRPRFRRHKITAAVLALGALAYWVATALVLPNIGNRWETCTVTNLTATGSGGSATSYRVYTRQCDVLEDSDNLLRGKSNSATVFGQIQVGQTYTFHVVGERFSLTSNFPNILAVQPATAGR